MNKLSILIALLTTRACFAWQANTYQLPRLHHHHSGQHSSAAAAVFLSSALQAQADDSASTTSAFDSYQPGQATLATKDIVVGSEGEPAAVGDVLTISVLGTLYPTDKNFVKNPKYSFELGAGQTMPGFDKGLVGMKRGGKRLLRVPPVLAFHDRGSPEGRIPPNADLEYDVEVLAIATSDIDKTIAKIGLDRILIGSVLLVILAISPFFG